MRMYVYVHGLYAHAYKGDFTGDFTMGDGTGGESICICICVYMYMYTHMYARCKEETSPWVTAPAESQSGENVSLTRASGSSIPEKVYECTFVIFMPLDNESFRIKRSREGM